MLADCDSEMNEFLMVMGALHEKATDSLPYYLAFYCGIFDHKPQHLLLQLRIHFVRDDRNVGKEQAQFQMLYVFVQRRKNAYL